MHQSLYKTYLIFTSIMLILGLILLYSSPFAELPWDENWRPISLKNYLPFIIMTLVALMIFVFQREIKLAKTQQQNDDFKDFNRILELQNNQLINELSLFRQLYKTKDYAESKLNEIFAEIKDKVKLSQIYEIPEFAITLIDKIIKIKDEFGVKLQTRVEGNLSTLKRLNQDDLKQTVSLMFLPICENYQKLNPEDRRDIFLSIKEFDNKVTFKVTHDYMSSPISTEMMEWNIKKLLTKYGCSVEAINEKEDELLILMLTIDIPKENKKRKII